VLIWGRGPRKERGENACVSYENANRGKKEALFFLKGRGEGIFKKSVCVREKLGDGPGEGKRGLPWSREADPTLTVGGRKEGALPISVTCESAKNAKGKKNDTGGGGGERGVLHTERWQGNISEVNLGGVS